MKKWFSTEFCEENRTKFREHLTDFANRNGLQPGEFLVVFESTNSGANFHFMYYAERELN